MSEKDVKGTTRDVIEGYQPTLAGLKTKEGKPLQRKDLKPPKGGTAIQPPKPSVDKASQG